MREEIMNAFDQADRAQAGMKLSEAIRLGAMLLPQASGSIGTMAGSCALGAAADAVGIDRMLDDPTLYSDPYADLAKTFPILATKARCPACGRPDKLGRCGLIAELNDIHEWTRERIADWVATIEAQQEQAQTPELEAIHEPVR
jgi:hypothetical protein